MKRIGNVKKKKVRDTGRKNINWTELSVCVVHWLTYVPAVLKDQNLPINYIVQSVLAASVV